MPRLIEAETLQGAPDHSQGVVVGDGVPLARRDQMSLGTQELQQFGEIGWRQIDDHEAALALIRNRSQRRSDDNELLFVEANPVQTAPPPAHRRRILQRTVKILQVK